MSKPFLPLNNGFAASKPTRRAFALLRHSACAAIVFALGTTSFAQQTAPASEAAAGETSARERARNAVQSDRDFLEVISAMESADTTAEPPDSAEADKRPPASTAATAPSQKKTTTASTTKEPASSAATTQKTQTTASAETTTEVKKTESTPAASSRKTTKSKPAAASEAKPKARLAEKTKPAAQQSERQLSTDGEQRTVTRSTTVTRTTDDVPPVAEAVAVSPLPPAPARTRLFARGEDDDDDEDEDDEDARERIAKEQIRRFVQEYVDATGQPTPDLELAFYSDQVDYFDSGKVSRKVVDQDQRTYYRRWPQRNFSLISEPKIEKLSEDGATVRFRMKYTLASGKEQASGEVENVLKLRRAGEDYKIAGIRERKLSR